MKITHHHGTTTQRQQPRTTTSPQTSNELYWEDNWVSLGLYSFRSQILNLEQQKAKFDKKLYPRSFFNSLLTNPPLYISFATNPFPRISVYILINYY